MATIRKRGNRWQVRIQRRDYSEQSRSFLNKVDADRWARTVESEMDRGVFECRAEAERTTLDVLFERYLREVTPRKKGANAEGYLIGKWRRHKLALSPVASIRASDVAKYRDEALTRLAASTVRNELNLLSAVFDVARKEWGYSVFNPVRDIRKPSMPRGRARRLSKEEEALLLAECDRSRAWYLGSVVRLALETAARLGELHKLRWKEIDLQRRTAFIRDAKNGESRLLPLSSAAMVVLQNLPRSVDGRLFPVSDESIKSSFHDAVVRARAAYVRDHGDLEGDVLVDLRFHDLRHEAVSRLFELGLNPMEVASISGHKTLSMLQRYTHLRAEDLARKLG